MRVSIRNRPRELLRWLPQATAIFFLSWNGWTLVQAPDPLHGISRQDLNISGTVRSIISEEARTVLSPFGLVEGSRRLAERMTFDTAGRLQDRVEFDARERADLIQHYVYSGARLVLFEEYKGLDAVYQRTEYTHDASGRKTVASVLNADLELQERLIYHRDEEGRVVEVEEYDGAGTLLYTLIPTVTENETRVDRFDAEGELHSWSIRLTDEEGRLVSMTLHSAGFTGTPFTTTYEMDDRGNVTRIQTSGSFSFGFLTVTPGETLRSYAYTYDRHGNWVERVALVWVTRTAPAGWQTESVTYRNITY